jgi:triacylglycerol lipase
MCNRAIRDVLLALGGLVVLALILGYSPPGCAPTDPQPPNPDGPPTPALKPVDYFRRPWDSEDRVAWRVTQHVARLSQIAYDDSPKADEEIKALGFTDVKAIVRGPMAAYVASGGDVTVIAFRGTDNDAGDWIANLNVLLRETPHGSIHAGFAGAYDTLRADILDALEGHKATYLWITGHSLGGALAVVCAYDLVETERRMPTGLITFGQPMVATDALAAYLDQKLRHRYVHVVNEHDIVPRVPPFFAHCGTLVWFIDGEVRWSKPKEQIYTASPDKVPTADEKGELAPVSPPEFEQIKGQIRARKAIPKSRPDEPQRYEGDVPLLRDHPIAHYLEKVQASFKMLATKP